MNWRAWIFVLTIWLTAGALGCERVALMPRRDVDRRDTPSSGPYERERDLTREERDRDVKREVVGTVRRVDDRAREIHLLTTEGRDAVIKYDSRTAVSHRDRSLRVEDLRDGDLVLVEVARDARGDQYAEVIRMNDRTRSS
jgi:hypothetical protein